VFWGGTPAINVNIPVATATLDFTGPVGNGIDDEETGLGDIAITPMVGWHRGNLHWLVAATLFAPTGKYDTTTVDLATREIDALSIGKNVWALQPVVAATWLDPATGHELSGAASIVFSTRNDATDYQTAPQLNAEVAALQHLPSGFAFGLTGYAYQQLGNDSGQGAENIQRALGATSLEARVFSAGAIATYNHEIFGRPASFKLSYTSEFGARRRFESDTLWLTFGLPF
jgi:hypothetical protein